MRKLFLLLFSGFILHGFCETPPSLEEIQKQLDQAEADFQAAKEMFNPWYGGPLLTGSGNVLSPGDVNIQPYLYVIDNYAAFDSCRHSHSIPSLMAINPVFLLGVGVFDRADLTLNVQGIYQRQSGRSYGNIGDTALTLSLAILKEKPYVPAVKFWIKESFPTGKYEKFRPSRAAVESTGSGAYDTVFGLNISKIVFWSFAHPMQFRFSTSYDLFTHVHVKGFNTYGGGYGADGKVSPGGCITLCFGAEFSCTQKFVLALDIDYQYHEKDGFKGESGTLADGFPSVVGAPSRDNLSLAPALEYNFSSDLALIAGAWFSVWGRNTLNFAGGIITVTYTF